MTFRASPLRCPTRTKVIAFGLGLLTTLAMSSAGAQEEAVAEAEAAAAAEVAAAEAAPAPAAITGDVERGRVLAYTCHGCHGIEGYRNHFPTYRVPLLGGQQPAYMMAALNGYATGDRAHATMHSHAATLTEQERADIAAYIHGQGSAATGQVVGTPPPATAACVECHGADGAKPLLPDYPILAGQHPDYLLQALRDYKSGKRKNPIMAGIISGVEEKDFEAIAQFFANQRALCGTDVVEKHGGCPTR